MKNLLNLTTNGEINNFSIAVAEIFNTHLSQFPNVQKKFKVSINGNLIPSSYPFKNQSELVVVEKEIDINNSRNLHMWLGHETYSHVISGKYIRSKDNVLANADCDLVANILLAFLEQCYLVNDLKFRSQNNITSEAIKDLSAIGVELLARGGKAYGTKTIEKALSKYTKQLKVIRSLEYVKPTKKSDNEDSKSVKKVRLYCTSGCAINEFDWFKVPSDEISDAQSQFKCSEHENVTLSTEIIESKVEKEIRQALENAQTS